LADRIVCLNYLVSLELNLPVRVVADPRDCASPFHVTVIAFGTGYLPVAVGLELRLFFWGADCLRVATRYAGEGGY
jgi:hypothetical protein